MYIGEAAKRTGATPKAIRLYEQLGLIPVPKRKGTYRVFREADIELIQIIKQAQLLSFTLSEMKSMLSRQPSCEDFPWDQALHEVKHKIASVAARITSLEHQKQDLTEFLTLLARKKGQEYPGSA